MTTNTPAAAGTAMQCLECGLTRTTQQRIRRPERQLTCSAGRHLTTHRVMVDTEQGDWREELNREAEKVQARPAQPATPHPIPSDIQRILDAAGVAPVWVDGLDRAACLMGSTGKSHGRPLLLLRSGLSNQRLVSIAADTLRAMGES